MMTPLDAAEHEMEERGFVCDAADARAIITAFLEAAADSERIASAVGGASAVRGLTYSHIGKAAILALKETING